MPDKAPIIGLHGAVYVPRQTLSRALKEIQDHCLCAAADLQEYSALQGIAIQLIAASGYDSGSLADMEEGSND